MTTMLELQVLKLLGDLKKVTVFIYPFFIEKPLLQKAGHDAFVGYQDLAYWK